MRMIERWFPCAEVSEASASGWGSGKSEKALFTWFAARPLAQAKAAVLTSLLPWPEDEAEQRATSGPRARGDDRPGRGARRAGRRAREGLPGRRVACSTRSRGRAMIPLEAARLGVKAWGIDYSPVATLAGQLSRGLPAPRLVRTSPTCPSATAGRSCRGAALLRRRRARSWTRSASATPSRWPSSTRGRAASSRGATSGRSRLPCQECGRRFP